MTRDRSAPYTQDMLRLAILAVLLVACRRDPAAAPSCGEVAGKFHRLAQLDLERGHLDPDARRAVLDQLPAMRDSLAHACADTRWSEAVRRCLGTAVDHLAFETCQQQLTEEQRRALERSARGEPVSP